MNRKPYEPIDAVVKGARLLGVSDWRAVGGLTLLMSSILVVPTPVWLGGTTAAALLGSMHRRAHRSNARPALAAFIVAAGLLVFSAIAPFLVVPATGYGGLLLVRLSVIPLTACAFWFSDRDRHTVSALWFGVTVGACASGLFAIVETVVLGNARASGLVGNAISFGDLALLFGALSLALHGLVHLPSRLTVTASATAAACGVLASTMSGSRGGWVAFPVMVFGVARLHRGWLTPTRLVGVGASLLVVVASATWMSGGMPMNRASASFVNASEYASTTPAGDAAASSEGARIEAWRSAASAFRQHPATGVGWGNLQAEFRADVAAGLRNPRIGTFDHAHNQILGAAANGGLLGLSTMIAIFAVPGWYFRRSQRSDDPRERTLGTIGLMVVASFAIFGLTEAIFESLVPVTCFAVLVSALASQLGGASVHTVPRSPSTIDEWLGTPTQNEPHVAGGAQAINRRVR